MKSGPLRNPVNQSWIGIGMTHPCGTWGWLAATLAPAQPGVRQHGGAAREPDGERGAAALARGPRLTPARSTRQPVLLHHLVERAAPLRADLAGERGEPRQVAPALLEDAQVGAVV